MTHISLFGLTYGPVAFSVVVALVAEMLGADRAARIGTAALLASAGVLSLAAGWTMEPQVVLGSFVSGGSASTVGGAVLVLAALGIFGSGGPNESRTFPALLALGSAGAALAVASADLVAIFICLEVAALCGYSLVSLGGRRTSQEAAIKYFVQGAVATGLLVLGAAALVPAAGDLSVNAIAAAAGANPALFAPLAFGVIAITAGLAFKVGAAPFHSWAPDAYEQSDPPVASVLAGPIKLAMIATLATLLAVLRPAGASAAMPFGVVGGDLIVILGVLAVLSVVIGSAVALTTPSYTRMLGYAGVTQAGYAFIALAAGGPSAAIAFAVTYAVASVASFMAAESFRRVRPSWDGRVASMAGLGSDAPVTSAALTIVLMSLAGIPPLFGFWGKFQAFGSAVGASAGLADAGMTAASMLMAVLAITGIVGSVVSLGYYGAVVRALYFTEAAPVEDAVDDAAIAGQPVVTRSSLVVILVAGALLILGIIPLLFGITATLSGFLLR